MDPGFTGGNVETLRKNLHSFLRPKILKARFFKKITKDGSVKYEICDRATKGSMKLKLGTDITCEDLSPMKITKKDILNELKKITINDANVDMEKYIEDFMRNCL